MYKIRRIASVVIACICCMFYLSSYNQRNSIVTVSVEERGYLKVVLMDSFNNLIPVTFEMPFVMDEIEAIQSAIEYMHLDRSYHDLNGYLNNNAYINTITIDGDIANIDVNKSFFSINPQSNRKVVEGLVKVIQGNSNIEEIVISIDGNLIEDIPYTSIPIKNLFYNLPINVFKSQNFLHSSIPITKYVVDTINSNTVFIPITFYMEGTRCVDFIIDVYKDVLVDDGFFTYVGDILNKYSLEHGILSLDFNSFLCIDETTLNEERVNILLLMLFDNLPIESIQLSLEGQPYLYRHYKQTITRKDLVYNIWKI